MKTILLIAVLLVGVCNAQYQYERPDKDCPETCYCYKPYNMSKGSKVTFQSISCKINYISEIKMLPRNMTSLTIEGKCQYSRVYGKCIYRLDKDIFANFTQLKHLYIRNTNLQTLPDGIFNRTKNLDSLRLVNNPLNFHSDSQLFTALKKLTKLSITNSDVIYFGETFFRGLDNLRDLDLNNNAIRCFPYNHYTHLPALTTLKLSSNQLSSFHYSADFGSSKLENVFLENNKIESLHIYSLSTGNLRKVSLIGNKLKCSCEMYKKILNVGYHGNVFVDAECTLPHSGNNSTKYRLTKLPESMECPELRKEHC